MLWPTELACVSLLHANLSLVLVLDRVAFAMTPPRAGHADDHQFTILIAFLTEWALLQTVAGPASRVAVEPGGIDARLVFAAVLTQGTPFAFPCTIWYMVQRWFGTVDVVRDVTVIAKDRVRLVMFTATPLTDCAVQTSPAFLKDHLCHLHVDTMRMVALTTLGTAYKPSFQIIAKGSTHHTDVLHVGKVILV